MADRNVILAKARNTDAVHEIARSWTIRNGPNVVLKWANSRPTTEERTLRVRRRWGIRDREDNPG